MSEQLSLGGNPSVEKTRRAFSAVLERLSGVVTEGQFKKFLAPLNVADSDGEVVVLNAPGRFVQEWVSEKYRTLIEAELSCELERPIRIAIEAVPNVRGAEAAEPVYIAPETSDPSFDDFTFENFVVGKSNLIASSGAQAVAREPGKKCNPLYIYGDTGLGKTHLLHAIANQVRKSRPNLRCQYMTAQQFSRGLVDSIRDRTVDKFLRSFARVGVWLLDDVQFLDGKEKTQEEVFHLFNDLIQRGYQVVLSADRPPRMIPGIDERLRSRFESGLVAEIGSPDTETRAKIIEMKSDALGHRLSAEVCEFLAVNTHGSIRTLTGAVLTLITTASFNGQEPDLELAKGVLATSYARPEPKAICCKDVVSAVADHLRVEPQDLLGPVRKARLAHARHVAIYIIRKWLHLSWNQIGQEFSGRDHTSIMHAFRKVDRLYCSDQAVRKQVDDVREKLGLN